MKPISRKHHYLPQAYLAAFTHTKSKDGQFYVIDTDSGKRFRTTPKNIASERDFNRVDIDGESIDVIEQALSPFEDLAIQAIRKVNNDKMFPEYEGHNYILNLLCLIAVRNPKHRKLFNKFREEVLHKISAHLVKDEETWNHHLKIVKEAGNEVNIDAPYKEVKQFIEEREYQIEFSTESNLQVEFKTFDKLLPILGQRTWSLFITPEKGPYFLCSDHPIALSFKNPSQSGPIGYGLKDTEVFFPLGPHTGIYGVYENPLRKEVTLSRNQVVMFNWRVIQNAERHVISATESFLIPYIDDLITIDLRK